MIEYFILYLILGAFTGIMAGTLGVGGGVIVVPLLNWILLHQHFPESATMHLSIGTSLSVMIFTSATALTAHHKKKAVRWDILLQVLPGLVMGSVMGIIISKYLSGTSLKFILAFVEIALGVKMLINRSIIFSTNIISKLFYMLAGFIIATISALLGIGGGLMSVPFLTMCNKSMYEAIGTSIGFALVIGIVGTIGFIISGWGFRCVDHNWCWGYIFLPATIGIMITGVSFAPIGAQIAHSLPVSRLKRIFGIVLVLFGILMFCE